MSSGWPAGLQSERRQQDFVRVIVLLALLYACARARHELWLARGPTERTTTTGWAALAIGYQRGATGSKRAIEPVVGFEMGKDARFQAVLSMGREEVDPLAMDAKASPDLHFAAEQVAGQIGRSRQSRQELQGLVKEPSNRTKPLSQTLWQWQPPHGQKVAGKLQLGFVAVLVLLIMWYGAKMPGRFVVGFQGSGKLEESRLWQAIEEPEPIPEHEVYEAFERNKAELLRLPLEEEAQLLWDSCLKEQAKQVGLAPVSEDVL